MQRTHDQRKIPSERPVSIAGRPVSIASRIVRDRLPRLLLSLLWNLRSVRACRQPCIETMDALLRSAKLDDLLRLNLRTLTDIGIDQRDALWLCTAPPQAHLEQTMNTGTDNPVRQINVPN